jgi:predicted nucleic acid-binding protein
MAGKDSSYSLFVELPPTTSNAASDCLSFIFDAEEFSLFVSPYILRNTLRVLVEKSDASKEATIAYIDAITEIVTGSGGAVIDPPRKVHEGHNLEDNLILNLVVDVDALVLVTDDTDLTELDPWNGRLLIRPRTFMERAVRSRQARAAKKPAPGAARAVGHPRVAKGNLAGGEFTDKQKSLPEISLEPWHPQSSAALQRLGIVWTEVRTQQDKQDHPDERLRDDRQRCYGGSRED